MDRIEELLNKAIVLSQDMAKALTQQHYDVIKRLVLLEQEVEQAKADLTEADEMIAFRKESTPAEPLPKIMIKAKEEPSEFDPFDDEAGSLPGNPKSRKQKLVEKSKKDFNESLDDGLPF